MRESEDTRLTSATIQQMIGRIQLEKTGRSHLGTLLWLDLPIPLLDRIYKTAGVNKYDFIGSSDYVSTYFEPFEELVTAITSCCIYKLEHEPANRRYFLHLHESNRLYVKYQSIIGSRYLATLTDAEVDALVNKVAAQFAALKPKAKAATDANAAKIDPKLLSELAMLSVSGNKIALPAEHLSLYPKIKQMLQRAGGKYSSKGHFAFEAGIDCQAVLDKLMGGGVVNLKKDFQFFATPAGLAKQVCEAAGPLKGMRVLEPSAGDGALADIAREMGAEVVTIETWDVNVLKLQGKGYTPMQRDFLSITPEELGLFDAIVANPPFTKNQDIDHVQHMLKFLKPGGKLSVIMSTAWQVGSTKKQNAFKDFLATQDFETEAIDAGTFSESGTDVPTVHLVLTQAEDLAMAS